MLRPILAIVWGTILYILKEKEAFANWMLYISHVTGIPTYITN